MHALLHFWPVMLCITYEISAAACSRIVKERGR